MDAKRKRKRGRKRPVPRAYRSIHLRVCAACDRSFYGQSNALTCSDACRVSYSRYRAKRRAARMRREGTSW